MREFDKKIKISVIIPVYNGAQYICNAIGSVKYQKVDADIEIIVVDDGSIDNIDQIMDVYKNDSSIRYVKNGRNRGVAESRNRGVRISTGDYIAFLDSDDYWTEDKLQKQLDKMLTTDCVLCCTSRELMTPDGRLTRRVIPVKEHINYDILLKHNCINCSSVLIKKEVAQEIPMEHEDSHEDYITWMKVLKKYDYAVGINEPLLKYRLSASGKSGSKIHSSYKTFKAYKYMGFGNMKSFFCFIRYAINGIVKYGKAYLDGKIQERNNW